MRHHALDKGPLPTHTCPPENLTAFPGNRRTKGASHSQAGISTLSHFGAASPDHLRYTEPHSKQEESEITIREKAVRKSV